MIKPEEQIVTIQDYERFMKGERDTMINHIWESFIADMPDDLRVEAYAKGFRLEEFNRTSFDVSYLIEIPNASEKLKDFIREKLYPHITCLLD